MFNYELIKHLRKLHNVTQKELAEKLNVARGTLANDEIRTRTLGFTTLVRICDVLTFQFVRFLKNTIL